MEPFFQILKFELGSSRFFRIFSLILKKTKGDGAVILLSNDKQNSACYHRENYFDMTYMLSSQSMNTTGFSIDMAGGR